MSQGASLGLPGPVPYPQDEACLRSALPPLCFPMEAPRSQKVAAEIRLPFLFKQKAKGFRKGERGEGLRLPDMPLVVLESVFLSLW